MPSVCPLPLAILEERRLSRNINIHLQVRSTLNPLPPTVHRRPTIARLHRPITRFRQPIVIILLLDQPFRNPVQTRLILRCHLLSRLMVLCRLWMSRYRLHRLTVNFRDPQIILTSIPKDLLPTLNRMSLRAREPPAGDRLRRRSCRANGE